MSRMADEYQEQQEQENLSGADLCEAWYHEQSMRAETLCDLGDTPSKGYCDNERIDHGQE